LSNADLSFFGELQAIVQERLNKRTENSYTAALAAAGIKRIAQKVGEEGVELALAAVSDSREDIIDEAADLVYHLIVLLADREIDLAEVADRLQSRHASAQ
jgi:phosphoribosyl-ATP pyrophosphohydrolase/phosphoribosyl-AMP cyclohydrolase